MTMFFTNAFFNNSRIKLSAGPSP